MSTQVNFVKGSEPAQLESAVSAYEKGRLRLIVLLRHVEQRLVRQPLFQGANRRCVAAKRPVAEGIDQIEINFLHCLFLFCYGYLAQKDGAFQIKRGLPAHQHA